MVVKVHPEGINRCNANLMANYMEFKMNDANGQLKTRSEVVFPVKGSRTSTLYSFRLGVKVLNCLFVEMSETDKYDEYDASNEYQIQEKK